MEKTQLQKQLEQINDSFDTQEGELKKSRQSAIDNAWEFNVHSGQLKTDLATN